MNSITSPIRLLDNSRYLSRPHLYLRCLGLILFTSLFYTTTFSQASQGFEGISPAMNCAGSTTCDYEDPGSAAVQHFLANTAISTVTSTGAAGVLGFISEFTPSRSGTSGSDGLTEGDFFGVAGSTLVTNQLGAANGPPEGSQAFFLEDTDGWATIYFDYVDLTGTTTPMFSMRYFLDNTSWEVSDGQNDRFYARIVIDMCASATTVTLLDTDGGGSGGNAGGDIDLLGIEGSWNTLSANLTAYVGCRAQLIVEFDSNSSSEEGAIDDIVFTQGTRQPFTGPCVDAAPPTITCPGTQTRSVDSNCNYMVEDFTGLATTSDDCGPVTVTQSPTAGNTFNGTGNTPITLIATDGAANSTSCVFTLTLQDVTAPSISCPTTQMEFLDANCMISIPDYTGLGSASDNCDASPGITQIPTPGTPVSGVGISAIALVATDASGNSSSCTFAMQRIDNTAPSITCPGNQTRFVDANCDYVLEDFTGFVTTSDNCDASPTVTQNPVVGFTPGTTGAIPMTMTATDASGNSAQCNFLVLMNDNIAPSITCPGTQTEPGDANCMATLSDYTGLATTSDNCDANPTVTQSPPAGTSFTGSTTVTLIATDFSGNSTSCTFSVQVTDTTMPSITCPGTQTQFLDANCQISTADYTGLATVSDNCDATPTVTQSPTPGMVFAGVGGIFATLIATDASGNSNACTFALLFQDNTPPSLTCPGTQTEPADANCMAVLSDYTGLASTSDNCDASPTVTQSPPAGTTFSGSTMVTLTSTDASGNSTSCTFMVEAQDNTPPTASCVGGGEMVDQTNNLTYGGASAVMGGVWQAAQSLTVGITGPLTKVRIQLRPGGGGNITLRILSGNNPHAPQTVLATKTVNAVTLNPMFVLDSPVNVTAGQQITLLFSSPSSNNIVCVSGNSYTGGERYFSSNSGASYNGPFTHDLDFTTYVGAGGTEVCLDANGMATLAAATINDGSTDNCGPVTFSVTPNMFTCADIGSQSVTLVVTDQGGLSSSCTTTVEVKDKLAPTAVCTDVTVNIDVNEMASVTASQIAGGSFDNCSAVTLNIQSGQTNYDCDDVGMSFPVTVVISDASGNSTSCTRNVTVADPFSNCCAPADAVCMNTTIQLDANGMASITPVDVDGGSTAECGLASMTVNPNSFTCANVGSGNMVTLTVTDVNGDSDACIATVTVEDNVAPNAQCTDTVVQLDGSGNGSITPADIDNGSSDACGIASLSLDDTDFTCADVGGNTVTLTVTDVNGNVSTCTATVTVQDNVAPNAQCTDTIVQLDGSGNGSITPADIDNGSSDACGIASLSVWPNSFNCSNLGPNSVSLTVTDNNGNSASCTATATVVDNIPPNPVCLNPTVFLQPDGTYTLQDTDVLDFANTTDNCSFFVSNISPAVVDCDDFDTTVPVTVTVSDQSGNTATCVAMVNVQKGFALPAGWDHDDVGGATGDAGFDPCEEKFIVESNGITHPLSDKIHFAWVDIDGDFDISAEVTSITAGGLAGIMARESLAGGSKKVALRTQLSVFVHRDVRATTNGYQLTQQLFKPQHRYLRLKRIGNLFLGYTSINGTNWSFAFFTTVSMNSCIKVGLFAEGPIDNVTSVACFENVSVSGATCEGLDLVEGNTNTWTTDEVKATSDFRVFPNPASNEARVDLSQFDDSPFTLRVLNNLGQVVYHREYLYLEDYLETLDLSQYNSGIYMISIELEDGTQLVKKLVVSKK